ncbi:MAG: hypothetical protein LC130_04095 [Bryobacterales bacterium]|nr:hypothetical protein [Bryobacterales bacterium]
MFRVQRNLYDVCHSFGGKRADPAHDFIGRALASVIQLDDLHCTGKVLRSFFF